jgi:hypothetical protein
VGVGVGVGDGVGLGVGEGVGEKVGDGVGEGTGVSGPIVYPSKDGVGKVPYSRSSMATDMKSCQIAAGIVPPYTVETPWMFSSGIAPSGHPIQTQVTSEVV